MSLLVLHCFAQLAAEQIRCGVALICSPGAVLANGWAGKNFIWGSSWRKQQGKGAQRLRIPLRLLPGARGTRGTSSLLFWGCFSLRICGIFAVPLHPHQCLPPWCLDMAPRATKTNPISRHFQAFPGISSGFGEREGELLLFQAVPCQPRPHPTGRCQEWGDTMRCPPQHPQWTQIQGNLWIHPRGSGGSGWVPHPTAGKTLLVSMNKCKRNK